MFVLCHYNKQIQQQQQVADSECARGGGVSHILAEKGLLASFQKMHENAIFSPIRGGGRTPGTPYARSANDNDTNHMCNKLYRLRAFDRA